ncbi:hypothetical protein C5U62_07345 [Pseudomonas protegens]|uniref:Uncharacterized protein n=1 Tax=Pseudomonas protegens TaxID=380021 RepID=A0A2T6GMB2_9PSED|nr:hypothetical protein C5U62_07345 [Pseudomonas protegens]RXU69297.1 hypothetical protein CW358_01125 [Pseudomonas protegens]
MKTTAFGNTALKTGSECSFGLLNSASSPVFALSCLHSRRFHTACEGAFLVRGFWLYCREAVFCKNTGIWSSS